MRRAVALAPAKINIGLEITGRRPDGFHNIVSILQTVSLYDRFEWDDRSDDFRYESPVGLDGENDLTRKALALAEDLHGWTGRLRLRKSIPLAAGLGGGSSDAALGLILARSDIGRESMFSLASQLGSDVPFFLEGGTSLATGTGTDLEPLQDFDAWCVIVTPRVVIPEKTRSLYAALSHEDHSDGSVVSELARNIGNDVGENAGPPNAFEHRLMHYQEIRSSREALLRAGAPWVTVSGAGPALYTLVKDYMTARSIAKRVPAAAGKVFVARTLPRRSHHIAAENLARCLRIGSRSR